MFTSRQRDDGRALIAACAMAMAAAVGTSVSAAPCESPSLARLERYCTTSWKNAGIRRDDWEDATQQTLLEMLEQTSAEGLSSAIDDPESIERRELNRAVWRIVQRSRRSRKNVSYNDRTMPVAEMRGEPGSGARVWSELDDVARDVLSERQRSILDLTRQGWRVSEIADKLQIPASRVSDEKYKAIARLREEIHKRAC